MVSLVDNGPVKISLYRNVIAKHLSVSTIVGFACPDSGGRIISLRLRGRYIVNIISGAGVQCV